MTGLGEAEIAAFRADGFVVIRGCLSEPEHAAVSAACERSLTGPAPFKGRAGTRLRMFPEDGEPRLAALATHPGLMAAMRSIWGRPCLYLGSFLWANGEDTPWHTAGVPGEPVQMIRVTVNLDQTSAENGALHVIPGTHVPEANRGLYDRLGAREGNGHRLRLEGREAPGAVTVATRPGDVLLWWNRLWHGAWARRDGRPRRALFLSYVPDPLDDAGLIARLRDDLAGILGPERPALYAPSLLAQPGPDIAWMAERLEALTARPEAADRIRSRPGTLGARPDRCRATRHCAIRTDPDTPRRPARHIRNTARLRRHGSEFHGDT